ncbi:MAG: hypothetical protein RL020_1264 [Pseudomonadota bacterium]|jgi:hypothetical protein
MYKPSLQLISLSLVIASSMAACGGGGGGSSAPVPRPTTNEVALACSAATDGLAVLSSPPSAADKPAGVAVFGCVNSPREVKWTQTAGAPVVIYADRMQAMSFEPKSPGAYTFNAAVVDAQGVARNRSIDINVAAASVSSYVGARLDQSVFGGSDVSLRAWAGNSTGAVTYSWQQVQGPTVTLLPSNGDTSLAQFVAPTVAKDELFKFLVTAKFANGATDTDEVMVVVQQQNSHAPASATALFDSFGVSPIHGYKANGKYVDVLASCVYEVNLYYGGQASNNLCPFSKLPLISLDAGGQKPTIDQIMDHVAVSHDWMGANLESFLRSQEANGDFQQLLGSVTAIVIGSHVRPSFYTPYTGAIYLDAENLWLTSAERDVINEAPDFRSNFGSDLKFIMPWRYVLNNKYARLGYAKTSRYNRSVDTLVYDLGDLLYHELAHANDALSSTRRIGLNPQLNTIGAVEQAATQGSKELISSLPLNSTQMAGLAAVDFQGKTATLEQKAYTPEMVAAFFAPERATDEYNFNTQFEDFAMLYEEFMMQYRHGVQRDVAVTSVVFTTPTGGRDVTVAWGQRGRIAEPTIKPRIKIVLQQMAPWIDPNAIDAFAAPIPMRVGESWFTNIVLPSIPGSGFMRPELVQNASNQEMNYILQRMQDKKQAHQMREKIAKKFEKAQQ